jgi:hypothetical protein
MQTTAKSTRVSPMPDPAIFNEEYKSPQKISKEQNDNNSPYS